MKTILLFATVVCLSIFQLSADTVDASMIDSVIDTIVEAEPQVVEENHHHYYDDANNHKKPWEQGTLTSIAPFLFVVLIVVVMQVSKYYKRKQTANLAMKYLELGKDVPDNLMEEKKGTRNNLQIGIILTSIGIGAFIMFAIFLDLKMSSIAAVPFFLGLGFILIHRIESKKQNTDITIK